MAGSAMKRAAVSGVFGLALLLSAGQGLAQDGTATQEASPLSAAALDGPPPGTADKPRDPSKGAVTNLPIPRYVSLKGSEGNARRGPGLTHRIDWVFTREGMPLKITAEYENWRRVEDIDGAGGWVHYSLLSGVRNVLISQDMAQAYSRPDTLSEVLYQSELGVVGKMLQCVPDWCRIAIEGEKGWLPKTALWGVGATEIYP